MNVQPIRLIGASRAAELRVILLERLQVWWKHWSDQDGLLSVEVMEPESFCPVDSHGDVHERPSEKNPLGFDLIVGNIFESNAMVAWRVTQELEFEFFKLMCCIPHRGESHTPSSALTSSIVRDLIEDLVAKLLDLPRSTIADQDVTERSRYTKLDYEVLDPFKYFRLTLDIGGLGINVWVPKVYLPEIGNDTQVLTDADTAQLVLRKEALAAKKVGLYVTLGEAEITIDELSNLKVGDVIGLDKHLDEPLIMERKGEKARFNGFLGSKMGNFGFLVDSVE